MSFGIVAAGVGGALVSGLIGADASRDAADTQANAANRATDTQLQMFNTINAQQAPWRQAGQNALGQLLPGGTDGAPGTQLADQFTHQFNAADLNANMAPNYEFMRNQGLMATANARNATGGYLSGNTLRGLTEFGNDYAGNAYQQAFQNYTANQTNIFNRLSSIAGLGQTANQATGLAGTALANQAGTGQMAAGAAQAAGTMGASKAISGGLNNALGWYSLPQIMNWGNTSSGDVSKGFGGETLDFG